MRLLSLVLALGAARFTHQAATGTHHDLSARDTPPLQPPKIPDTNPSPPDDDEPAFDADEQDQREFRRPCVRDCIFEHCKPECDQDWNCYRGCIPKCNEGCKDQVKKLWEWVHNIFEGVNNYDKATRIIEAIEAGERHPEGVSLPGAPKPAPKPEVKPEEKPEQEKQG